MSLEVAQVRRHCGRIEEVDGGASWGTSSIGQDLGGDRNTRYDKTGAPAIGQTCHLFDEDESRWVTGRVDHFDDGGQWIVVLCEDGLMAAIWTRNLGAASVGGWCEPTGSTATLP